MGYIVAMQAISLLVNNNPGVLARVSELFAQCGYNIDKLRVGIFKEPAYAIINIRSSIDSSKMEQLVTQLSSMLDVIQVKAQQRIALLEHSHVLGTVIGAVRNTQKQVERSLLLHKKTRFWLIAFGLFITVFGTTMPSPLYALYRIQWQLSTTWITLIFVAYAVVVIPTILASGQLSDRLGRKNLLILGVFFSFLGSISFSLASNPFQLLGSRILQGLSIGMLNGVALAALTELDSQRSRTKAALVAAIAVTSGNALGPLFSGVLGQFAPYPTHLSFLLHAIFTLPCILGLLFVQESRKLSLDPIRLHLPTVPGSIRSIFLKTSVTSFLAWAVISMVLSILPTYLNQWISTTTLWISGALITTVFTLSTVSQFLLRKRSMPLIVILGYSLLSLGLIGLTGAIIAHSFPLLLISVCLIGIGHGPTYSGTLARLNEEIGEQGRGDIVSAYYIYTYLGVSMPVFGLGIAADHIGLIPAIVSFTIVWIGLMAISLLHWLRRNKD